MIASTRVTASTTAAALVPVQPGHRRVLVRNRGAVGVYVGGDDVTTANGFLLDAGDAMPFDCDANDALYVVTASSTAVCHVLAMDAN